MKKIAIVTIQSINYGNRLQNYALYYRLSKICKCQTLYAQSRNVSMLGYAKRIFRILRGKTREDMFARFDANIPFASRVVTESEQNNAKLVSTFDYFIAGSDQIWNPNFSFIGEREFLTFAKPEQRVAYAASIGLDKLPKEVVDLFQQRISGISSIAMREESGAKIVKELTGRDVPVVLDPTMLLTVVEWRKVEKRSRYQPNKPYIFKYSLGIENASYNEWIEKFAEKNNYEIFELEDISAGDVRAIGPAEFISLIDNSEFVCTDSFHGTVFSILFQRPFITLQRPSQDGFGKMSSRLDTLLNMLHLENQRICCVQDLSHVQTECDFTYCTNIIKEKKKEAEEFLRRVLKS